MIGLGGNMGFFDKIKKLFNKSEQRLLLNAGDHQLSIEETEEETENKEKNANILMNNLSIICIISTL